MERETHKLSAEETASIPAATQLMLDSSPAFLAGLPGIFDSSDPLERVQKEGWKALSILNEGSATRTEESRQLRSFAWKDSVDITNCGQSLPER